MGEIENRRIGVVIDGAAAHASVLLPGSMPLWTALLAVLVLGERLTPARPRHESGGCAHLRSADCSAEAVDHRDASSLRCGDVDRGITIDRCLHGCPTGRSGTTSHPIRVSDCRSGVSVVQQDTP